MSDHIPGTVLCHISALLPVASLLRFRCVCKFMNRLIDSSSFLQNHLALQKPRFIAMYDRREFLVPGSHRLESSSLASALFAPHPESRRVNLIGTLHGIVCFHYVDSHIMISNLSIRKFLILPLPQDIDLDPSAFNSVPDHLEDDNLSTLFTGFWIDFCTKEFKIVMFKMSFLDFSSIRDAVLFTSNEHRWTLLSPANTCKYQTLENPAVIIRGKTYWKTIEILNTTDEDDNYYFYTEVMLVSFDFCDDIFGTINAPVAPFVVKVLPVLYRMRDNLCLMYVDDNNTAQIYMWREEEWSCKFTFEVAAAVMDIVSVVTEADETFPEEERLKKSSTLGITNTRDWSYPIMELASYSEE